MQIPEIPAQRKFISAECHAHSNAHKPQKTVAPTRIKILTEICCSRQYLSIDPKKKFATPTLTHTNRPSL